MTPEMQARVQQVTTSSPKKAGWLDILKAGWGARPQPEQRVATAMPAASIQGGALPPWAMYAAIGGVVLVTAVALTGGKKKGTTAS